MTGSPPQSLHEAPRPRVNVKEGSEGTCSRVPVPSPPADVIHSTASPPGRKVSWGQTHPDCQQQTPPVKLGTWQQIAAEMTEVEDPRELTDNWQLYSDKETEVRGCCPSTPITHRDRVPWASALSTTTSASLINQRLASKLLDKIQQWSLRSCPDFHFSFPWTEFIKLNHVVAGCAARGPHYPHNLNAGLF